MTTTLWIKKILTQFKRFHFCELSLFDATFMILLNAPIGYLLYEKEFDNQTQYMKNKSSFTWINCEVQPILAQFSISIPPEIVRKPKIFLTLSGGREITITLIVHYFYFFFCKFQKHFIFFDYYYFVSLKWVMKVTGDCAFMFHYINICSYWKGSQNMTYSHVTSSLNTTPEAATRSAIKKVFLKISQNYISSFQLHLKRDSSAGVFLYILWHL